MARTGSHFEGLQVTLAGAEGVELQAAEQELDELVREAFATLEAEQVAVLFRMLRRTIVSFGRSADDDPEVEAFLDGLAEELRPPVEQASLIARGLLADFTRRNAALQDALKAEDVAELLKVSRQTVYDRLRAGKLLALESGEAVRFPAWQFAPDQKGGLLRGLREVLTRLAQAGLSPLDQHYWLTSPKPEFDGRTPVELLAVGRVDDVCSRAAGAGVW